jgi:hypothetical protein
MTNCICKLNSGSKERILKYSNIHKKFTNILNFESPTVIYSDQPDGELPNRGIGSGVSGVMR